MRSNEVGGTVWMDMSYRFSNENSALVDVELGPGLSDVERCCFAVAAVCLSDN